MDELTRRFLLKMAEGGTVPKPEPESALTAGLEGAATQLTFGAYPWVARQFGRSPEQMAATQEAHPWAHGVGSAVGFAAPLIATAGAAAAPRIAAGAAMTAPGKIAQIGQMIGRLAAEQGASKVAQAGIRGATEGAIAGVGSAIGAAGRGQEANLPQAVGLGAALGGGLGAGVQAAGSAVGKALQAARTAQAGPVTPIEEQLASRFTDKMLAKAAEAGEAKMPPMSVVKPEGPARYSQEEIEKAAREFVSTQFSPEAQAAVRGVSTKTVVPVEPTGSEIEAMASKLAARFSKETQSMARAAKEPVYPEPTFKELEKYATHYAEKQFSPAAQKAASQMKTIYPQPEDGDGTSEIAARYLEFLKSQK